MWVTENFTPFAVERAFVRDVKAREHWVVAVRATLDIEGDGRLSLAEEQRPVVRSPKYRGDPIKSSLLYDTDFPLTRRSTDVIVEGSAWAPGRKPASVVDVSLSVGPLRKSLRVYGPRLWLKGADAMSVCTSSPRPFVSMPIEYERSWGGSDPEGSESWPLNPVGRGFAKRVDALLDTEVHNIEVPSEPTEKAGRAPQTAAGLGAIAPHWQQRLRYAGTYDAQWERTRAPLYPKDFDPQFFQIAPADQQVTGFLRGGEVCTLRNLTPEGELRFALPKCQIQTTTYFVDRAEDRVGDLHLVVIDTTRMQVELVWHVAVECQGSEHTLLRTRVRCEGERFSKSSRR